MAYPAIVALSGRSVQQRRLARPIHRLGILALVLSCAPSVSGLDPDKSLRQYVSQSWCEDLPNSSVNAIFQTSDGYLWIGTQDGLARFDGVRFTSIARETVEKLDRLERMTETKDGSLWLAGRGGLARFVRDRAEIVRQSPLYDATGRIRTIHTDLEGALWIATSSGLLRFRDGRLSAQTAIAAVRRMTMNRARIENSMILEII